MAVTIYMYDTFSKKPNSTKVPGNSDTYRTFSCVFLDAQSIMNPVIQIEQDFESQPMLSFSYAYIPSLNRYYFINNTVITSEVIFTYYLQEDLLASYKNDFLNTTQYVLRATNVYNDDLIDNIYPLVPMPDASRFASTKYTDNEVYVYDNKDGTWSSKDLFHVNYTSGAVLFGVTGQGSVSCDHYVASVSAFKSFIDRVVTAVPAAGSWGNLPTGVQTALSNFLQYITYVKWIPFFPVLDNVGASISSIYLGDQQFTISAYKVEAGLSNQPLRFGIRVPDHPLYSTHHYYNFAPFREVNLFYPLIGNIPLDTTKLHKQFPSNSVYVTITMIIDLATADTEYTVVTTNGSVFVDVSNFTDNLLASGVTNIGVDLSLSEYSMSLEAALASGVSYIISNSINDFLHPKGGGSKTHMSNSGDTHGGHGGSFEKRSYFERFVSGIENTINAEHIGNTIYDAINNIIDLSPIADSLASFSSFAASSFGQVSTSGHTGSFLMSVCTQPVVYCWFKKHSDDDASRFGRPYSDTAVLNTISGFCACRGANYSGVNRNPLKPEIEGINRLLNSGIYIE